jgi:hypothetical protein
MERFEGIRESSFRFLMRIGIQRQSFSPFFLYISEHTQVTQHNITHVTHLITPYISRRCIQQVSHKLHDFAAINAPISDRYVMPIIIVLHSVQDALCISRRYLRSVASYYMYSTALFHCFKKLLYVVTCSRGESTNS